MERKKSKFVKVYFICRSDLYISKKLNETDSVIEDAF